MLARLRSQSWAISSSLHILASKTASLISMYLTMTVMLMDLRFVSAAQTSPLRCKLKHQTNHANWYWMSHRHFQLTAETEFRASPYKLFPLLPSPIPTFPSSVNGTATHWITAAKNLSIAHGPSLPFILTSIPVTNPVDWPFKILLDSCFYNSPFLSPSHWGLPSSFSSITVTASKPIYGLQIFLPSSPSPCSS